MHRLCFAGHVVLNTALTHTSVLKYENELINEELSMNILDHVSGNYELHQKKLSPVARTFVKLALKGVPAGEITDYHVRFIGTGGTGSGCSLHSRFKSWLSPVHRIQFLRLRKHAQVRNVKYFDQQYFDRLFDLSIRFPSPCKLFLHATDWNYDKQGKRQENSTSVFVPNEHIIQMSGLYKTLFTPVGSVHPFRPDALDEIDKCAGLGVKMIKWSPEAMNINPDDAKCISFYDRMQKHNMTLVVQPSDYRFRHWLGFANPSNPQLLRTALDAGLRVIVSHCGGSGLSRDVHNKSAIRTNFEMLMEMMEHEAYQNTLFTDLSGMLHPGRTANDLKRIIASRDLHPRLVHGSDFPNPMANIHLTLTLLWRRGYLNREQLVPLCEIYQFNPLLFDIVTKLTVRNPDKFMRLPKSVVMKNKVLESVTPAP